MLQDLMHLHLTKRYVALLTLLLTLGGYCAQSCWKSYTRRMVLRKLRKCKQKQKLASKGKIGEQFVNAVDQRSTNQLICNMSMEELINYLKEDVNNYNVVFNGFQSQALFEDQRLNCVVEFLKLDVSEVNLNGPFAGIPISIKDNVIVKGYESYVGCSSFLNKPKPKDNCVLLKVLLKLGAIPFVKTTVPQTMMTILSSNPIDGITKNPQNLKFIPGGSSSGEGAIVGSKASILGFGSDIGGSVRIPAAFCGVVGFKPTVDRISTFGGFTLGIHSLIKSVYGPICRDVKSCSFVMKSIYDSNFMSEYDPQIPRVPFNNEDFNKQKLKIGYFIHDDSFHVMPAMSRAVMESVARLRNQGHEVIEWKPPRTGREWWKLFLRGITIDGCNKLKTILIYDKIDDSMKNRIFHIDYSMWNQLFNFIKYSLPDGVVDCDEKFLYKCCKHKLSTSEYQSLSREIEVFKRELINDWISNDLDAVLCPAGGFTALPLKCDAFFCPLLSYIFIWNLVNFPAGTVPVTKVNDKDLLEMRTNPIYSSSKALDDVRKVQMDTRDLSVSVQCVGLPWKDEMCLNLMKQLE